MDRNHIINRIVKKKLFAFSICIFLSFTGCNFNNSSNNNNDDNINNSGDNNNNEDNPLHLHETTTEYYYDNDYHYHKCTECNLELDKEIHDFGEYKVSIEPTCTEKGIKTKSCKVCNKLIEESVDSTGHTMIKQEKVEATCLNGGIEEYYECSKCFKYFSDKEGLNEIDSPKATAALGHRYSNEFEYNETSHWYKCQECGVELDKENHEFSEFKIALEPTCTEKGRKTKACKICNKVVDESVEQTGHTLIKHDKVEANCLNSGVEEYFECSKCSKYFLDKEGLNEIDSPKATAALGHRYSNEFEYNETSHWHKCEECGTELDKENHDFSEFKVTLEPTCTEKGRKTKACKICNKATEDSIDPTGHTLIKHDKVEATCLNSGVEEYYECSKCFKCFLDKEGLNEIDSPKATQALGHNYSNEFSYDDKNHWRSCLNCDKKESNEHILTFIKSESGHYKKCDTCEYQTLLESHNYSNILYKWNNDYSSCKLVLKCDFCMYQIEQSMEVKSTKGEESITYIATATFNEKTYSDTKTQTLLPISASSFGSYPQTKVDDSSLVSELSELAGQLPSYGSSRNWTPYDYYLNWDGHQGTYKYMWYIDINHNGEKYRGVYFLNYRGYNTLAKNCELGKRGYQDDNGYYKNNVYWFKWEKIEWNEIKKDNGEVIFDSKYILDSQHFYHDNNIRTIEGEMIYPNNYKYSDIRTFLNNDFYNDAFLDTEKESIKETNVNNSNTSTDDSSNAFTCEDTLDNIYLLSYQEAKTYYGSDEERNKTATDYARCQGYYSDSGEYYTLRSPSKISSTNSYLVDGVTNGTFSYYYVHWTNKGIAPVLTLK